jgi:hypothetical protein
MMEHCGLSNNKNYKRQIWKYKRADYLFVKQKLSETDRVNLVTGASYSWSGHCFYVNIFENS